MDTLQDPYAGLQSYQEALNEGLISPEQTTKSKDLTVLLDEVEDELRLTYALLDKGVVQATAVYVLNGAQNGNPYFQVGYAVSEKYRNKGVAKKILKLSLEEIENGFKQHFSKFYVEAVVPSSNEPSIRVAANIIGGTAESITDNTSGEESLRFTRRIE